MSTPENTGRGNIPGLIPHNEFGQPVTAASPAEQAATQAELDARKSLKEPEAEGSLTKQAGYSTNMRSSIEKLPDDFDHQPASISKIAMLDNPTHPDMIGECRQTLVNAKVPAERIAIFDASCLIQAARGKSMLAQRTALNSFWRVQFAKLGTDGFGARQLLVEVGNDQDWHNWFRKLPLDVVLQHNLPMPEHASE